MTARAMATAASSGDPPLWSHVAAARLELDYVTGQMSRAYGGMVFVR